MTYFTLLKLSKLWTVVCSWLNSSCLSLWINKFLCISCIFYCCDFSLAMLESTISLLQEFAIWSIFTLHINWTFWYTLTLLIHVMVETTLSLLIFFTVWSITARDVFPICLTFCILSWKRTSPWFVRFVIIFYSTLRMIKLALISSLTLCSIFTLIMPKRALSILERSTLINEPTQGRTCARLHYIFKSRINSSSY